MRIVKQRRTMTDEDSFKVYGWMRSQLRLKGSNLMIYAIIYQATQEKGEYAECYKYLEDLSGTSKVTVIKAIKELVEMGIITKWDEPQERGNTISHLTAVRRG